MTAISVVEPWFTSLTSRHGTSTIPSMTNAIELMMRHRSIRRFEDVPVPEDHIRQAVEAGQMGSTSAGIQSYCVMQITDEESLAKLVEFTGNQTKVARCGAFFIICGDTRRHRLLAEREETPYDTRCEAFLLSVVDATIFAQNMSLAFESMGYGICYIGGLRNQLNDVATLLKLPKGIYPLFGLCVGTPAQDPTLRPRLPLPSVLFKDAYPDDETMHSNMDDYDRTMLEYFEARGAGRRIWSEEMANKFKSPKRIDLGPFYRSQGADLD